MNWTCYAIAIGVGLLAYGLGMFIGFMAGRESGMEHVLRRLREQKNAT